MLHRVLCILVAFAAVFGLVAADSCTILDAQSPMGGIITGYGSFTLENTFSQVNFAASETTTGQYNSIKASADQVELTWSGSLNVVPGNYDVTALLITKKGMQLLFTPTPTKINVTVK